MAYWWGVDLMLLRAESVCFAYGARHVVSNVDLRLDRGTWLTIVGPNGAGKTTLLRCLLGLLRPTSGAVFLDAENLRSLSRRQIARRIALLPQQTEMPFGFTVRDVVAMGRTPHVGRFQPLTGADRTRINTALANTDTTALADRRITELSGGEVQRVFLARALAQDTPLLALDEPTTNLDLFHEQTLLDQVQQRQQQGTAVVAVLHDLNLAARYSDQVLVLSQGRVAHIGPPRQILTPEIIEEVFRVQTRIWTDTASQQIRILT